MTKPRNELSRLMRPGHLTSSRGSAAGGLFGTRERVACDLLLVPLLAVLALVPLRAQDARSSQQRILHDIQFLASDELEGRGVGTKGLDRAAEYIREQFQKAGLKPGTSDGTYFQTFDTPNGSELDEPNRLVIVSPDGTSREQTFGQEFVPLAVSGPGRFNAPLAFLGYGITAPRAGYDDYADADVKGKAVIVLDGGPGKSDQSDPHADPHAGIATRQMDVRAKVSNAASHGAAVVLFVRDPRSNADQPDRLMEFGEKAELRVAKIPVVQLTHAAVGAILESALGKELGDLQAAIDGEMKPQTVALPGWTCSGEINVSQKHVTVKNVLGTLPGSGPHADETIVIGAHYDHLGYGEAGSMAPGVREIHNGADDNASGTSGLIELGRRLAARGQPLPRRVVFAAFTAEERGLHGSDYYVNHPAVPLEKTVAMINLDMIGRLRNDKLIVEGVGTADEFRPLVTSLNKDRGFQLKAVASGKGPSDQTPFCLKNIPVLFFWTDYHAEYHKPADDWDKISIDGIDRIVGLVEDVVVALASAESRPAFVDVPVAAAPAGSGDPSGERAYLGTIPAFGEESDGVLLSGVTSGAPASQAGIRGGDTIVRIGDMDVHNLQDMQTALESHRPGERIRITVRRGALRITYPVTLGRRRQP